MAEQTAPPTAPPTATNTALPNTDPPNAAQAEAARAARRARGGTIDRKAVQVIANLAHHIHEHAVAIERTGGGGDQVLATVGQAESIQDNASDLFAAASELWERVIDASGLSQTNKPVSSSAGARSPGALHDEPRAGDGSGAATGPGPSSDAA